MRHLLTLLILAASAFAQTATISDTIRTPFNGTFSGTVTVSLNSPALAQPLYSGNVTLSGWTQTVTVTAGVFTLTLYTNDLITPGGTSYTATYAPTTGSGWKETWIVPSGATTIREIRSTTVPSPSVRFTPSQITQAGATLGQGLRWNGSIWAPAAVLTDPMTTTGDLITRSGINAVRVGIGSTNQVLTVSGGMPVWASGITGNASTATALAANGTNCSAGSYPLGVDASGNAEGCTVAGGGGGSGTVTSVSVVSANGVSGTVANPTTTPAITLSLGAITPTSVAATGTVSGSNLSGTNTGDQTNITGNAGTATALAADPANCSAGTLPRGVDASGVGQGCAAVSLTSEVTGTLPNANTTATSSNTASAIVARDASGNFTAGTVTAALTGNASTATTLATPRAINGVSFDGSAPITITANLPSNPAACPGGQYVTDIAADGTLTCASVAGGAHTQNTDSGTTQTSFQIDSTNSGPRIKNNAGVMEVRNAADSALAALTASTVTAALTGNASTATALAANGTNCSAGSYPLGVDASGNAEGCTAAVTASTGLSDSSDIVRGASTLTTPGSVPFVTSSGVLGQSANFRFFSGTGNLVVGTTTDGNFKLDVANSGSSGGFRVWDQRATIGSTSLVVRAGGGQSGNLTEWQASNGTTVSGISTSGLSLGTTAFPALLVIASSSGQMLYVDNNSVSLNSPGNLGWTASVNATSAKDLSLSRASANTLQVGDGGANSNGDLAYREWRGTARTFANLGTPADGTFVYCSNCTVANPCASGGTGAFARRLNAAWVCSDGSGGGGGSGTVTSVSVSTGLLSVTNPTTTPDISIAGTSGGVPYFSNGTTLASSAALDAGALVVGGGAGGAPTVLANSSVPNAGELRISTTPTPGATRAVFTLGSAITGGNNAASGGTFYALNAPSGFVGDFMRFELNGTAAFAVNRLGTITIGTANTYGSAGVSVSNVGTLAFTNTSAGASAASRITGSAGTGSGNFLALRPTSASSGPDVLRVNADQRGVMIGQTAETASISNLSLGVFDDTASTGVTRHLIQKAANQGTVSPFEVRDFNATLGDGALLFEIEPDGSFRSLPTGTRPTCASGIRGTYWYTQGGTGVKDAVEVCAKDAADVYAWRVIY